MKKYKITDNNNRFFSLPGDCIEYMQSHIDKVVGYAVLEWGTSNHTKVQLISDIVGKFIYGLLKPYCPTIALELTLCNTSEKVDMNMVLDSLGTMGTRIGALAYVVAILLETLIPDDGRGTSEIYLVKRYEDHTCEIMDEKTPASTTPISACYAEYIDNDRFVYTTFLKPNIDRLKDECE